MPDVINVHYTLPPVEMMYEIPTQVVTRDGGVNSDAAHSRWMLIQTLTPAPGSLQAPRSQIATCLSNSRHLALIFCDHAC